MSEKSRSKAPAKRGVRIRGAATPRGWHGPSWGSPLFRGAPAGVLLQKEEQKAICSSITPSPPRRQVSPISRGRVEATDPGAGWAPLQCPVSAHTSLARHRPATSAAAVRAHHTAPCSSPWCSLNLSARWCNVNGVPEACEPRLDAISMRPRCDSTRPAPTRPGPRRAGRADPTRPGPGRAGPLPRNATTLFEGRGANCPSSARPTFTSILLSRLIP